MADNLVFQLRNVHYSYLGRFPALAAVDLNVRQGEKIAVIGANGTGKSTLLHMLDGLIFADQGMVTALGRELKEDTFNDVEFSRYFRSKVGFVFQNPEVQLFCPTVKEDIVFGPLQLGIGQKEARLRLEELIEVLNIADLVDRQPHQLSMGEKRKVALATTLAIQPDVLILDEPTAGLDPLTCRHIIDIIIKANDEGRTVITSTHDLHIIEEIADRVCVFSKEKTIIREGEPQELLKDTDLLMKHNLVHIHSHHHKDKTHIHPHEHIEHHHEEA